MGLGPRCRCIFAILLEMSERNCILFEQQHVEGETEKPPDPRRSMCSATKPVQFLCMESLDARNGTTV